MRDRASGGRSSSRSTVRIIVLASVCLLLNLVSPWSFAQGSRPDVWPGAQSCFQRIPWQVGLKIDGDKLCGGVLISPRWVATAGHCVVLKDAVTGARAPLNQDRIRTFMGNTRRSQLKPENYRAVKKVIVHESYIRGEDGDLALLELDGAFAAANVIGIASAADMQQHWVTNAQAVVSGWGVTASGATVDDLREESVNFVSTSACRSNPGLKGDVTERMVCAGDAGKDSCFGDSGGPLSLAVAPDNVLAIGVVSFGAPNACGLKGVPGVYTKLAAFQDWIVSHTGPLPPRKQAFGTCADR